MLFNDSSIVFDEDKGNGKGRHFTSRFIEAGVCSYNDGDNIILVKKETIDRFLQTMIGCPVIINHAEVNDDNVKDLRVGVVSNVWFNDADGWFYCEGILDKGEVETLIDKGFSVSCAYTVLDKDTTGGIWHDIAYDEEVLNGTFDHLAIVSTPRYRDASIVLNSTTERKEKMLKLFNAKKNESEDKTEDEKKDNANIDKRAVIDEIGGILKDKISEEDWRTIVGKIETIAYEGSEDSSKDNESDMSKEEEEKDESEDTEDKGEEKENESDDAEKDKEDEDEKTNACAKNEADEDEKEVKENASNFRKLEKLRNTSMEVKAQVLYEPECVRLNRGKNY